MGKSRLLLLAFVILVLSTSCAPSVSRSGDYGRITVAFGDASSGRFVEGGSGLETGWPDGRLPAFSSVTVTVSAADMSTVTTTASLSSGTLTVQVPAGAGRLVQLSAVPAANSTAPYFAKAYSGSASVDVGQGETKSVTITLGLEETKIPLCVPAGDTWNWYLAAANSLTETPAIGTDVSLYFYSDIEYDEHGRLFVSSDNRGIQRFNTLTSEPEPVLNIEEPYIGGLAYQKNTGRLFFTRVATEGPVTLAYVDVASGIVHNVDLPAGDLELTSAIAADDTGIYIGWGGTSEVPIANATSIQKIIIKNDGAVSYGPTYSLNFSETVPLFIQDMIVKDGVLYVAANNMLALFALLTLYDAGEVPPGEVTSFLDTMPSFGKIIALNAATLGYEGAIDWSSPPSLSSQPTDIYCGPLRFLGFAQGKLYVADAGIKVTTETYEEVSMVIPSAILGRAVEVDTPTLSISRTGLGGSAMPLDWLMAERTAP